MGRGNRSPEEIADAIAFICANTGQIRATLARDPVPLDVLLAALRDGGDPAEPLETVHRALRRAQDALGVFGRTRDGSALAGISRDRPREPVLLCPRADHPCTRFAWPDRSEPAVCAVTGTPLRRTTLAP